MSSIDEMQKVAVVGAGIMGILSAYTVQRHIPHAQVTLYDEQGFTAQNASYMAGGMLAPLSELDHMPIDYLPVGFASISLWEEISKACLCSFEFSQQGSLFISHDADRHMLERFKSMLPKDDQWHSIDARTIQNLEPALPHDKFRSALYLNGEAHLNPRKAMRAILDHISDKRQETAQVDALANDHDYVIDTRGMGAAHTQKLRGVKGETLLVRNPDFTLSRPVRLMHPRYPLYIIPRENHEFLIGATIVESSEGDQVNLRSGLELMSALYSLHPSFGDAQIIEMRAGIRPSYADNLPRITKTNNIITANGLYRHGFLFAPIMAACVVGLVTGKNHAYIKVFMKDGQDENHSQRSAARA